MSAKKNAFMLSSATLMMAKFGDVPVFDLNPADHSVGLAKEIAVVVDSSNLDLTAGIAQALVDTKRTNVQSQITGSVQEYSADNLLRAQGFGTAARQPLRGKLKTAAAAAAVSLTLNDYPIPGEALSTLGSAAAVIKAGDTLLIQHPTIDGYVFPCRAAADSTFAAGDHTVSIAGFPIPAGMSFPAGAVVWVVTEMEAGSTDQGDLFSVKIVGTLANFGRPVVYVAPKVQVTKGFNLSFTETQYGAMPWEMRGLLLTASEAATGRLVEIGTKAAGRLYAA
jgi:hypothetical protein